MKTILQLLITAILALRAGADPIADNLFPPELLQRAHEEITLTDEQRQHIQEEARRRARVSGNCRNASSRKRTPSPRL